MIKNPFSLAHWDVYEAVMTYRGMLECPVITIVPKRCKSPQYRSLLKEHATLEYTAVFDMVTLESISAGLQPHELADLALFMASFKDET